jgi:HD-GYP domain-containing protein (c-di-GMP phosphodiesterase class II)
MKTHPAIGEEIVRSIEGLSHLAPMIRAEHERWDGTGYPDGLKGGEIPLASCIVLVCDAYHAMVSDRPYRKAMSIQAAVAELVANSGTQFCPAVVDAFLERPTLTAIMRFSAQASPEAPDERLTAR